MLGSRFERHQRVVASQLGTSIRWRRSRYRGSDRSGSKTGRMREVRNADLKTLVEWILAQKQAATSPKPKRLLTLLAARTDEPEHLETQGGFANAKHFHRAGVDQLAVAF